MSRIDDNIDKVYVVITDDDEIQGVYAHEDDAIKKAEEINKNSFDMTALIEKYEVVK